MLEDLADLFEQSAANGSSVRAVVGEDPVEFVEAFIRNYDEGSWLRAERLRLVKAIDDAESEEGQGPR
jgi:DNA-binding ferritin-like protein (Dps family)